MAEHFVAEVGGLGALLPAPAWAHLRTAGIRRQFRRGAAIVTEGRPASQVFVLLTGRVQISRSIADHGDVMIAIRGPGEVIGDLSFLDGGIRSATVTALASCDTRAMTAAEFHDLVERHGVRDLVIKHACARLREGETLRLELAVASVLQRVAIALTRLSASAAGNGAVVHITQAELAGLVGASRNRVVEALGELRAQGLVRTGRLRIEITDASRLRRVMTQITALPPNAGQKNI